jgi:indoleamine 2,3-dioxygenase
MPPFMSYVAYSTYNYRFADPSIGTSKYSNLRLVRAFEHGLDPLSSEAGFVLTHVDMVKHTPSLVKGVVDTLASVSARAAPAETSAAFHHMLEAMQAIEASMETMWANSRPKDYIQYRTFIFGITNQSMFPHGVVYEGENNGEPMSFRGESGANDSIIPLLDNLLQIPMPQNPLTSILKDFRGYRPKPHREFLEYVGARADEVGVREHCCKDAGTAVLYLRLLEHVRSFRWRHWLFAREYIIRRTSHPTVSFLGCESVEWWDDADSSSSSGHRR